MSQSLTVAFQSQELNNPDLALQSLAPIINVSSINYDQEMEKILEKNDTLEQQISALRKQIRELLSLKELPKKEELLERIKGGKFTLTP